MKTQEPEQTDKQRIAELEEAIRKIENLYPGN